MLRSGTLEEAKGSSGAAVATSSGVAKGIRGTVWIDLDNSPHVPFFVPIIHELKRRGYSILLTARDAYQVRELVEFYSLDCKCIGHHYGKNKFMKLVGALVRTLQLIPGLLGKQRPDLAVAHGSRAQMVVASALGIPTLHIGDYEHSAGFVLGHPTWAMYPEIMPAGSIKDSEQKVLRYPGIKEDVYVPSFEPDDSIRTQLGLSDRDLVVTIRPPASEAHYHNPLSDTLFDATIDFLVKDPRVKMVVLPRNQQQAEQIQNQRPELFRSGRMLIPSHVVNGLNLIWFSDLVISGGGTMNREAAALGVPVYSIFRGKTGAVDKYLSESGRLVMIEGPDDLPAKVQLVPRTLPVVSKERFSRPAFDVVVGHITRLIDNRGKLAPNGASA
jgi:uncharacterized protein